MCRYGQLQRQTLNTAVRFPCAHTAVPCMLLTVAAGVASLKAVLPLRLLSRLGAPAKRTSLGPRPCIRGTTSLSMSCQIVAINVHSRTVPSHAHIATRPLAYAQGCMHMAGGAGANESVPQPQRRGHQQLPMLVLQHPPVAAVSGGIPHLPTRKRKAVDVLCGMRTAACSLGSCVRARVAC